MRRRRESWRRLVRRGDCSLRELSPSLASMLKWNLAGQTGILRKVASAFRRIDAEGSGPRKMIARRRELEWIPSIPGVDAENLYSLHLRNVPRRDEMAAESQHCI